MSQAGDAAFERWISAPGDLTFGEWWEDFEARAAQYRQQAGLNKVFQQALAEQQYWMAQQRNPYWSPRPLGGILSGVLGGLGRFR